MRRVVAAAVVVVTLWCANLPVSRGATATFTGSVAAGSTPSRSHTFTVTRTGPITASLNWNNAAADLNLFLYNPSGRLVASARSTTTRPETLSWTARTTGRWKITVRAARGSSTYTATVQHSTSPTSSTSSTSSTTSTTIDPPPSGERPNIVLILTDDQRWDSLWAMPTVASELQAKGVTFTNGFATDPLCCPSRASILQGAYPHTTGVYQNGNLPRGFPAFDDTSTVATWLDAAGYRTAMMGKYFNGYDTARATYVPPGWDRWVAFAADNVGGGAFYDYTLSMDGVPATFGSAPSDYSTDVLAANAEAFIRTTPATEPVFLYLAPYAPHLPSIPAPRHTSAFSNLAPHRPPNYDEADVSDKPQHIRALPRVSATSASSMDNLRRNGYRTLLAVDEAIAGIVDALSDTGRLHDTMIVFTSDNGYAYGEHRWGQTGANNKQLPYEEDIRVPYVVRYDALTTGGTTDERFALNIDLAPTFAALAGVDAPGVDGRSLLPLLDGSPVSWRNDFLVESGTKIYCAVRNATHIYVQYATGEQELYNLVTDPYQLTSRHNDPALAGVRQAMRDRLKVLCSPPPPGMAPID